MENFNFKKKYGQNFLIDNNVLNKIIDSIEVGQDDLIIEIGAGSGNLTKRLKDFNSYILAYEIDLETSVYLDKLTNEKVKIIYDDFLNRKILDDIKKIEYKNLYIIGNLPYYITTPIIEKIIKEKLRPKEMYFMTQKEVAERLSALPGNKNYGYITAYLNYYYTITKLFDVSPNSFKPIPNVESSIIKLATHNKYYTENEDKLNRILKESFSFKRKTLLNNLKKYNKKTLVEILESKNLSLSIRAEQISLDIFIELVQKL